MKIIKDEELDYLKRHCTGKKFHKTEAEAATEATRMAIKHKVPFKAYSCTICLNYHIGRIRNDDRTA